MTNTTPNKLTDIDTSKVAMRATEQAAFRLCITEAEPKVDQEQLAAKLKMSKGAFNTILNSDNPKCKRKRHLPRVKQIQLQQLCGNRAIDQWAELYVNGMLDRQRSHSSKREALLNALAKLDQEKQRLEGLIFPNETPLFRVVSCGNEALRVAE